MPDRVDETIAAIENEAWLTATDEPGRQNGKERRQFMANQVRQRLATCNRRAIEDALSLNVSLDNNPHHQKLRRGVRAIMLAHFVFQRMPPEQAGVLKQRWLNQSEDQLRRGFLACFPAINDPGDPARLAWAPNNFTDPRSLPEYLDGQKPYRFIVTCLPTDDRAKPTLGKPNETIASWAAISASVIDESNPTMYGCYGFVLRVPAENVLVANSVDQDLKNHLGTALTRTPDAEEKMSPMIKAGLLSQHLADLLAKQGRLKSPQECITENRNGRHNEVIVAGRSPSSGQATTVAALFFRTDPYYRHYVAKTASKSPITRDMEIWVEQCSNAHSLPILYIADPSGKQLPLS